MFPVRERFQVTGDKIPERGNRGKTEKSRSLLSEGQAVCGFLSDGIRQDDRPAVQDSFLRALQRQDLRKAKARIEGIAGPDLAEETLIFILDGPQFQIEGGFLPGGRGFIIQLSSQAGKPGADLGGLAAGADLAALRPQPFERPPAAAGFQRPHPRPAGRAGLAAGGAVMASGLGAIPAIPVAVGVRAMLEKYRSSLLTSQRVKQRTLRLRALKEAQKNRALPLAEGARQQVITT